MWVLSIDMYHNRNKAKKFVKYLFILLKIANNKCAILMQNKSF